MRTVSVGVIASSLQLSWERTHLSRPVPVRMRRRAAREQKSVALAGEEQQEAEKRDRERGQQPDRTPAGEAAGGHLLGRGWARHRAAQDTGRNLRRQTGWRITSSAHGRKTVPNLSRLGHSRLMSV